MNDTNPGACNRNRHLIMAASAAALLWGAGIPAAQADDVNLVTDKGFVSLGTFLNNSDIKVRVNGETTTGSNVDMSNTFGDKDVTVFRLDGLWRFNERHHMRMMYTDYSRKVTRTIDTEIDWQDDVFPVNARSHARFGFHDFRSGL